MSNGPDDVSSPGPSDKHLGESWAWTLLQCWHRLLSPPEDSWDMEYSQVIAVDLPLALHASGPA